MQVYDEMPSNHILMPSLNQASPLFYICFFAIVILILQYVIPPELLMRAGFSMAKDDVEVIEDVPDFFKVVNLHDAN